jgi:hypothetical protein
VACAAEAAAVGEVRQLELVLTQMLLAVKADAAKFVFLFFKDVTGMSLNVVPVREIDSGSGRVCARSRNHT